MQRRWGSLTAALLAGVLGAVALVAHPRGLVPAAEARDITEVIDRRDQTFTVDIACDARTFKVNRGLPLINALRGDNFIVHGKIFPGNFIPAGGSETEPGTFDPDSPGSIGDWTCRGTFNFDFPELVAGAKPHTTSTQTYYFGGEDSLTSDGPEGGMRVTRAVVGGTGRFAGATGEVVEEAFGTNRTGLFNLRFTFKLKKGK
jgi:hypothetical protein